jgi:hypothetical protein
MMRWFARQLAFSAGSTGDRRFGLRAEQRLDRGRRQPPMHSPTPELGPWRVAHFSSREARDSFLRLLLPRTGEIEAEPMPGNVLGALVRWLPGQFGRLNDAAYANGGRIIIPGMRGQSSSKRR